MGATTQSIDVNAPLRAVYNQWTQFEEFPRFMEGVDEVQQDGPKNLFWKVNIGGKDKHWEAEITEQVPEKRIAWQSVDGTPNSGEVTFDSLDSDRTRITLTMEYEPEGFLEKAGDAMGIPSGRVEGDLKRFRDFIENKGVETKGWRGQIGEREHPESVAQSTRTRGASFEDANEGTIGAEGRESTSKSAVISEIADGNVTDSMPAEGRRSLESASPAIELSDEPALIGGEHPRAPEVRQFYRESVGILAPTHEQIALRAYELYLARGQMPGHEAEDWLEAEKQLSERSGADVPKRRAE
jgi:hypothetical protein